MTSDHLQVHRYHLTILLSQPPKSGRDNFILLHVPYYPPHSIKKWNNNNNRTGQTVKFVGQNWAGWKNLLIQLYRFIRCGGFPSCTDFFKWTNYKMPTLSVVRTHLRLISLEQWKVLPSLAKMWKVHISQMDITICGLSSTQSRTRWKTVYFTL